jgi:hypothetical protein
MTVEVPALTAAFTADGTATGTVTVASTTGFYQGAEAFLINTAGNGQRVLIVQVTDATHLVVRFIAVDLANQLPLQRYGGGSNMVTSTPAWTLAGGSKISMPAQLVKVEPQWVAKTGMNV